jgi:hypothetical protein
MPSAFCSMRELAWTRLFFMIMIVAAPQCGSLLIRPFGRGQSLWSARRICSCHQPSKRKASPCRYIRKMVRFAYLQIQDREDFTTWVNTYGSNEGCDGCGTESRLVDGTFKSGGVLRFRFLLALFHVARSILSRRYRCKDPHWAEL